MKLIKKILSYIVTFVLVIVSAFSTLMTVLYPFIHYIDDMIHASGILERISISFKSMGMETLLLLITIVLWIITITIGNKILPRTDAEK